MIITTAKPATRNMKLAVRKIMLLSAFLVIFATSFVWAQSSSTSSSSAIRGGRASASAEQKIRKWRQWQTQRQLAQQLHHQDEHEKRQYNKDQWRHHQQRRLEQNPPLFITQPQPHQPSSLALEMQQQSQAQIIKSELEAQSTIYATIQKSLGEKYHIQWQLDQVRLQQFEDEASILFPFHSHEQTQTTDSERYPNHNTIQSTHHDNKSQSHHHHHRNRHLEDALDNAYATGRPGSTYGYNMFCGSSWAEASTSCTVRQNCPSGQSDECVLPGHECWAFTECDTRKGDGEQFSEMHGVEGAENLQATGVGSEAGGGYVNLNKPSPDKTDHYFCGKGYEDALTQCASHCPSGNLNDCPSGEICFFNTPCDARMMTGAPQPPSPTTRPTTPSPVVYSSKLNKYFCGYDWDDAQERCEVWCPSGSDDHCPPDQLCFAFSKCHAVDSDAMTMEQMEQQKNEYQNFNNNNNNNGGGSSSSGGGGGDGDAMWWEPGSGNSAGGGGVSRTLAPTAAEEVQGYYDVTLGGTKRPTRGPTNRPTKKPVMSAEQAMHRYSYCGAFWTDARDNCETKDHCEDDRDCPEFEYCWTQTPCDYYSTETPTTGPPTFLPSAGPTEPDPTQAPTGRPIGVTPTKSPTPEPTFEPTFSPTYIPTLSPTITPKPTYKPTFDHDDPSLTFFCGTSWAQADETCGMRCPSGNTDDCPGEFECWAFTSCDEERGIQTTEPTNIPSPAPITLMVPGHGGAQVPVFGQTDWSQFQPTASPAPTASGKPSLEPTLPPGVVAKEMLATYYCGKDWNDVEKNCHQACPSGNNNECEDPEHSCWAFVHACKAKTPQPTERLVTEKPTRSPTTNTPTRDPDSPTTPQPTDPQSTDPPTDLYGLLASQKDMFYCATTWDTIVCGISKSCEDNNDCPTGQSCFSSQIDCSQPQPTVPPSDSPTRSPEIAAQPKPPEPPSESQPKPAQSPSENAQSPSEPKPAPSPSQIIDSQDEDIDNDGEDWGSGKEQGIDNDGEDWDTDEGQQIDNAGEDWGSQGVNNEGEDWDPQGVNNDGEDWSVPKPTRKPNTGAPTNKPTPRVPTPEPTPEPTIDLIEHLDNLKTSYFCSESWDNIDCANAQACPSGDSKDCPKKQQCFSGTPCKAKEAPASGDQSSPGKPTGGRPPGPDNSPSPTIWTPLMGDKEDEISGNFASETETEVDEVTSKFFCGLSWGELVANCDDAKPCPSGTNAECEGGQSCFASTPCGKAVAPPEEEEQVVGIFNFANMVEKIPPFCKDGKTMSRNVGYWQSWSIYRNETCNPFTAGSIDASSYTHIVFSFASISPTGALEPWDFEEDIKGGQYQQFLDVRNNYPGTKAMIAVGGWTHNEPDNERLYRFSNSAATSQSRMKFAQSSVAFMRKYGFDGLDIDWEYPGDETRGGNATLDKDNLVLLCDELRKYFDDAPEKFELSIAVPASPARFEVGFDLGNLTRSIHFFNVMAYDLHGVWDDPPIVGAHSDIGGINDAVEYMITNGTVPASQIVLGLPSYGRSFTMANETCLSLGCPFKEDSNETAIGGCLDTNGFVPFVEIYKWQEEGKGKGYDSITVDLTTYSTVMVKDDDQLISYDDTETFKAKVGYATNKCLGGTMVWAIDMLPIGTQRKGGKGGGGGGSGGGGSGGDSATQSILNDEESILAFCGNDWDNAISTCNKPCPSGLSDDCEQGETCFANTPCGEGGVIAVGDTCKICPDTTSQGILSWIEVEVELDGTTTSTTCGELDYGLLLSVTKDSETCDAVKLEFDQTCCYDYPQDQCTLCRKGAVYYQVRTELNVTMPDGTEAPCGLVNKMLAPNESGEETCVTTKDALFEQCCYQQCSLCEGQGLKWWLEFDEETSRKTQEISEEGEETEVEAGNVTDTREDDGTEKGEDEDEAEDDDEEEEEEEKEETKTCSSIDTSLYSDFIEADAEQCLEIKTEFSDDCCYTFPTNPCGLCKQGDDTMLTLLWATEVSHEGATVSCGVVDNILNAEEDGTPTCSSAKETHSNDCCFDKCGLCDDAQLAWDFVIDYYNDTTKTCGDIEAIFAANAIESNSKECTSIKADYQEICCFTPPISACELCPEYVHWDEAVEFDDEESTCKHATAMLKREEEFGDMCSTAKEDMQETCCYELCDICGEALMLDWDAVVEYEGDRIACGEFKPIFGRNEIEQGDTTCSNITDAYRDFCCYTPPSIPCNLCQTETEFMDAYSSVEVEFWGSAMNCSDVYDYLVRRIESDSDTCSAAKEIQPQCCYNKCAICEGNQLQDFEQEIELDGDTISCLQLHTVRTSDIAANSSDCQSMQSKFASSCCYDAPDIPCVLCTEGTIRKDLEVDFNQGNGGTETCEAVANFLANRANNGTDECTLSQVEFQDYCCMDKCSLCKENEQIDWDSYVDFDGKEDVACGSFDWYFTSNAIEEGTGRCTDLQTQHGEQCCYQQIDYSVPACSLCKQGEAWYDINGEVLVYFEGMNKTCTEVSNSLFRKAEDDSGFCNAARTEYFPSCCFEKCDLCQGAQLDANVEVAYNETAATCLELGLSFAFDIIMEGSDECAAARELLFEPCCFTTPTEPCVLCQSSTASQGDVRDDASVSFYGSTTTCFDLNSFLVSREEQVGFMCQAAKAELQKDCCYQECSICGIGGNLYWDNPTTFNDITFACGELTWILSGNSVEEQSEECSQMQSSYYEDCCSGPSALIPDAGNKCEICPSGKDWYAQVIHKFKPMTCLELDSVLLQGGVFDDSAECEQAKMDYSSLCCYTPPERPCNLCQVGQKSFSVMEQTVSYNGADTNCYGIYNYLWTRLETEDDACLVTQNDLFDKCCYARCSICQDYQLDQEMFVTHDGSKMACSEIENHYMGMNQITKASEQCARIQQQHWNSCCYDVPCEICVDGDVEYELLVNDPVMYMGVERTCGDWSVLAEGELSQSDVCKTTKSDLFDKCCFKECSLCKDPGWAMNWNRPLTYDGLASTCLDVYLNLRSERVQDGDDRCQSIQFTVTHECCYKIPSNQCSLCQHSNGTHLNTAWNSEVNYQGEIITCGDVNAMLSSEELDSILCLSARDDLWTQCCTPQQGGNTGLGGILPTLVPGVSDSEESSSSGLDPTTENSPDGGAFSSTTFFRRNGAQISHLSYTLSTVLLFFLAASLTIFL